MISIAALPAHLSERIRSLNAIDVDPRAEFVVYWMHHAVRGHENAALDVAIVAATSLGKPLLVYQGLGGRHRFNSDRHHRFILEGARDAQRELAARGIRHLFWLPQRDDLPSPLAQLGAHAALLVCEDYPAPPMAAWTAAWARRARCAVVAVDASCIAPMRASRAAPQRAFAFRSAMQPLWAERLASGWPEVDTAQLPAATAIDPGFAAFDLESDLDAAIADCAIEHAIAPILHTPGGSGAGYARWEAFKVQGLGSYATLRNDAAIGWPRGVSRLSPYLHHGHVSPLRIAREAQTAGGSGADKFLDELLTWRELAFHWCFHTAKPERLQALPEWARQTLQVHAADPRGHIYTPAQLARSQTDSVLWNAAQDSLRQHGELHNNLRMTWGKAIVGWRPDPQAALDTLVELNHRYALDGNDPSSYGGLLWCLGLFDRPYSPELSVLGTVRPRDPQSHARRLDLQAYRQHVERPAGAARLRIGVIGAGMAGAAAARALHDQGHAVVVYEKSRGVGGRMATRRTDAGQWDHGARFFDVSDPRFAQVVADWRARGIAAEWRPRMLNMAADPLHGRSAESQRLVGIPSMTALARDALEGIALHCAVRIASLSRIDGSWQLFDERQALVGQHDVVVLAIPPAQAVPLLAASPKLLQRAQSASMQPCWTVMLRLAARLPLAFDAARIDSGPLAWFALDDSKPGRSAQGLHWVLQARGIWSVAHLETAAEMVCARLIDSWREALGEAEPIVSTAVAHRWLYALADPTVGAEYAYDADNGLGLAGDWLRGPRVEDAWLSGSALAGAVLRANSHA